MKENQKGVTLISLAILIAVILILTGVTIAVGNILDRAKLQKIASNMILIQTKVKTINERVAFNGDTSQYAGRKLKEQANKSELTKGVLTSAELENEYYYIFDQMTLEGIGLEGIKLAEDEVYIVNYQTEDVIFPTGIKNEKGEIVYRLSEMINSN